MILSQPLNDCSGVWANPPMPAMLHRLVMGPSSSPACGHGGGDGVLVGDVAAQRDGPPAGLGGLRVDLGRHGLDGVRGDVEAGHGGALGGQPARRGPPDARTGAGDQRHPSRVATRGDRLGGGPPVGIGLPDSVSWGSCALLLVCLLRWGHCLAPRRRDDDSGARAAAGAPPPPRAARAARRTGSTFIIGVSGSSSTTTSASGAL